MSTSAQRDSEPRSRHPVSFECKALLDAATKDLFRKNAFRITGLPVDATVREVARHADKLKMLAELGQDPHTESAAFPMRPPPCFDDIREAIERLKDPEKRLVDEFFWFWPEEFGNSKSDPAMQALAKGDLETAVVIWSSKENHPSVGPLAKHNLALVYYIAALDWENFAVGNEVEAEQRQKIDDYWKRAFNRWEDLATDERLWEIVTARIRQLNEPNLPTGFARRMRATLPEALDKINAELAIAFAESGKIELARLHIKLMRESNQGLDNVEKTAELVLTPARGRLQEQIKRAQVRADQNPRDAANAARDLLNQARQAFALFELFFDKECDSRNELFDEVAALCNRLQVIYHNETGDDKTCLEILKATLPFATSIDLRQRIEKNISTASGNMAFKKLEPAYAILKLIQDSKENPLSRLETFKQKGINVIKGAVAELPLGSDDRKQLFDSAAIVLRGISIDAWNNHLDWKTAIAAIELAVKYASSPELIQRLEEDRLTLRQMGAQAEAVAASQIEKSKNSGVGCLVVVAIFVVLVVIDSCRSTTNSSRRRTYIPPSTPKYAPQSAGYKYTPPQTFGGGNVYRVPSSVSSLLKIEKEQIESERAELEALAAQLERFGREIERDRTYLDRNSPYDVDEFNARVRQYNALMQKAKIASAALNAKVNNYNAKLELYGR